MQRKYRSFSQIVGRFSFLGVVVLAFSFLAPQASAESKMTLTKAGKQHYERWIFHEFARRNSPFCWKFSYPLAIGKRPKTCPKGTKRIGKKCYKSCPKGRTASGTKCILKKCPKGYKKKRKFCKKGAKRKKISKNRPATLKRSCPKGLKKKGALCYDSCPKKYKNVANVCWQTCKDQTARKTACGAGCALNKGACGTSIGMMVGMPLLTAAGVIITVVTAGSGISFAKGLTKGAKALTALTVKSFTKAALKAAIRKGAAQLQKHIVKEIIKMTAKKFTQRVIQSLLIDVIKASAIRLGMMALAGEYHKKHKNDLIKQAVKGMDPIGITSIYDAFKHPSCIQKDPPTIPAGLCKKPKYAKMIEMGKRKCYHGGEKETKGECWECPLGAVRTFHSRSGAKACKFKKEVIKLPPTEVKCSQKGAIKTKIKRKKKCVVCETGYSWLKKKKKCKKVVPKKYAPAKKRTPRGWKCPDGYLPTKHSHTSDKACSRMVHCK